MTKPTVLLTPSHTEGDERFFMKNSYTDALVRAGAVPLVISLCTDRGYIEQAIQGAHGLLLTGGDDIAPELFGEERDKGCGPVSHARDALELQALAIAVRAGIPVLGICRGIQVMNVALGGTLYQDMPGHIQTAEYHKPHHKIRVSGCLKGIYPEVCAVNSFHHQAIKSLAGALKVCAFSDDGYIEGVYMPDSPFFVGVQWHPERMIGYDRSADRLFEKFARECDIYKRRKQKNA